VRNIIKAIWAPLVLFGVFLGLGLFYQDLLQRVWLQVGEQSRRVLNYGTQVGVWLSGAYLLVRLINVCFWDRLVARTLGQPVPRLLKDLLGCAIFGVAAMGIVGIVFEQSVTGIWATSGAIGIVIGFALKTAILDVYTGLAVNFDRSFRIGDWLDIHHKDFKEPVFGKVVQINWRTTHIQLENNNIVILPNSTIGVTSVTNYSLPSDVTRFEVPVTLDCSVPTARAVRVLLAAAKAAVGKKGPVAEPEPRVLVGEFADAGVKYKVRYYLRVSEVSPSTGRSAVVGCILEHLARAGLSTANPRQDIFLGRLPKPGDQLSEIEERKAILKRVELFQKSLEPEELEELAKTMVLRVWKAGAVVIQQGDPGASMFVLAEGLAYVDQDGEQGRSIRVAQVTPGQTFGEMSLLTGEPRSATITAATDVVALEIAKDDVESLLGRRPEIAEEMSAIVAERRLRSIKALADAPLERQEAQKQTLYREILGKMKRFFGLVFTSTAQTETATTSN
jgi:small-conductance mechanosensitive channel